MKKDELRSWFINFLLVSIVIYFLLIVGGSVSHLWQPVVVISGQQQSDEILIRERIEKEVDRSYGRFSTQFQFALFLIGISVWVLRQSVIDRLVADVEKEFEKDYERFKDQFREKVEKLTEEFEVQKKKSETVERLSTSIPKSTYLKKFKDLEARKELKELVISLEKLDQSHSDVLTIRDRILLGDGFYFLAFYYRGNSLTNNCFPNKGKKPSSEVVEYFNKAVIQYKKATEAQTQAYGAWLGLGSAKAMLGEYKEAIQCLTTLIDNIESTPRDVLANAYVSRGLASRGEGSEEELRKAIIDFDKAIKIDHQCSRALYNKACYSTLLNDFAAALIALDEALKLIPKLKDDAGEDSDFDSIREEIEFKNLVAT